MCLGNDDLGQASLLLYDGRYTEYGIVRAIASVDKAIDDLKSFMVPNILEHLGAQWIFHISFSDVLQDGAIAFHSWAEVRMMTQGLADRWVMLHTRLWSTQSRCRWVRIALLVRN